MTNLTQHDYYELTLIKPVLDKRVSLNEATPGIA